MSISPYLDANAALPNAMVGSKPSRQRAPHHTPRLAPHPYLHTHECSNFNQLSQTSSTSQSISTTSGAQVYLGAYGLRSGPAGLVLDPGACGGGRGGQRLRVARTLSMSRRTMWWADRALLLRFPLHAC